MKESATYKEIVLEGKAEGRSEGEAGGRASAILRILKRRFDAVPESVRSKVLAIRSARKLEKLLDLALDAPSLNAFSKRVGR